MKSNFFRYHFGLEWEKRKIVRKVHAKRILQTAPHSFILLFSDDSNLLLILTLQSLPRDAYRANAR